MIGMFVPVLPSAKPGYIQDFPGYGVLSWCAFLDSGALPAKATGSRFCPANLPLDSRYVNHSPCIKEWPEILGKSLLAS
jgi:hypothetical protein